MYDNIGEICKYRRGDCIYVTDKNGKTNHWIVIISNDYQPVVNFSGHGKLYQAMKLSSKKPNEFSIPIKLNGRISYLICQNIHTYHENDLRGGRYCGYLNDSNILDLAIDIWLLSCKGSLQTDEVQKINYHYAEYMKSCDDVISKLPMEPPVENNEQNIIPVKTTEAETKNDFKSVPISRILGAKTSLDIPDMVAGDKDISKAIELAEEIITSPNIKKRKLHRFCSKWNDRELILFYILFMNNKPIALKAYGLSSDNSLYYKKASVVKELAKRDILR